MLQFYQNFVKVCKTKNFVLLIIIKHNFDMIFILEKNYAPSLPFFRKFNPIIVKKIIFKISVLD